jgi:hypothetical protein
MFLRFEFRVALVCLKVSDKVNSSMLKFSHHPSSFRFQISGLVRYKTLICSETALCLLTPWSRIILTPEPTSRKLDVTWLVCCVNTISVGGTNPCHSCSKRYSPEQLLRPPPIRIHLQ